MTDERDFDYSQLLVLPDYAYSQTMRFDCKSSECQAIAENLLYGHKNTHCKEELVIHHQKLDNGDFQTIVRHGQGEAVYLKYDGDNTIDDLRTFIWLEKLHEYLAKVNA